MENLSAPAHMDFNSGNVAERWRKWKRQFCYYFDAAEKSAKAKSTQCATLMTAVGPDEQQIAETFTWTDNEDREDYKLWLNKFEHYCEPRRNVILSATNSGSETKRRANRLARG